MTATLFLRPAEVAPDGKTKTVYVPDLRFDGYTPAQLMAGEGRAQITAAVPAAMPALPPVEDEYDDDAPDSDAPENDVVIQPAAAPAQDAPLRDAVKAQLQTKELMTKERGAYVLEHYSANGKTIGPVADCIIETHGEDARDLALLLDTLIANGSGDAEHVDAEDIEIVGSGS